MIIGVGCDIVAHTTTEKMKWHTDLKIRSRLFSEIELIMFPSHPKQQLPFLAGKFAVKEAVLKCLGTGMIDGISLKEIEVLKDDLQRPRISLNGQVQQIALDKGITHWHLSISHTDANSIAFVIAENI
jgi:holo-[acyl-carrier protein] synthase